MSEVSGESERGRWRSEAWPLALVLGLAALFFFSYFNRFAGVRSGDGEYSGGVALLAGRLPYRDYFTAGPPLNQLKSAVELAVFGKALIVSRVAGVVERLAIAALLYFWLRRSFSRHAAGIAAFVTIVVSAGDRSDPLASYNHDAILFGMLCGYAASLSLDAVGRRRFLGIAGLAGVAAGLSVLSKQTVGLAVAVGVLVVGAMACWSRFGARRCFVWVGSYVAGAVVPVVGLAVCLWRLGVLRAAVQMLFVAGPAAKASHAADFLARDVHIGVDNWVWVLLAAIAMAMSWNAVRRGVLAAGVEMDSRGWRWLGLGGLAIVGVAELLALTALPAVWNFSKGPIYYTLVGNGIVGIAAIVGGLRRPADAARLWRIALLAAVGWCVAVALSLSWPAFEAMTLPGLGLLVAAAVDGVKRGRPVLYALLAVTVFFQVREKLDLPFSFDRQDEPAVRFATQQSSLPALRGMRLPAETVRLLDETTNIVEAHGDGLFTYPEMGLLYPLSGANPPTWSGSHNIDVVSDGLAREDAERLLRAPPGVIVYARPTLAQLQEDEATWRHGMPSGQRDLIAAVDCLVAKYRLVDTFRLTPDDNPILLYERPKGYGGEATCVLPPPR